MMLPPHAMQELYVMMNVLRKIVSPAFGRVPVYKRNECFAILLVVGNFHFGHFASARTTRFNSF